MLRARLISRASLLLLPALALQGRRVRARTPKVPEAGGPPHGEVPGHGPAFRVLLLGESPIAGVGAPTHEAGVGGCFGRTWQRRTGQSVQWRAHGRNGYTAAMARDLLLGEVVAEPFDLLVVGLGVNDTLGLTRTGAYARDLRSLIDQARARFGPVRVVLSGLPPVHGFPCLPSPLRQTLGLRARLLDQVTREVAEALNDAVFVPLEAPPDPALFCVDGFHPGPRGYEVWAEDLVAATLRRWP